MGYGNIAIVEGLDVTLDGSAVYTCRWTQGGWLDASARSIRRVDFVLDCSYFKWASQITEIDWPQQEGQARDRSAEWQIVACIGPKRHPSCYWHRILDGLIYEGQAKCFSSRSLLGLPRLSNKCVTDQFRIALARKQMSLFASIINPANKNGYSVYPFFGARGYLLFSAQDHSSYGAHWAYKGCYLLSDLSQAMLLGLLVLWTSFEKLFFVLGFPLG